MSPRGTRPCFDKRSTILGKQIWQFVCFGERQYGKVRDDGVREKCSLELSVGMHALHSSLAFPIVVCERFRGHEARVLRWAQEEDDRKILAARQGGQALDARERLFELCICDGSWREEEQAKVSDLGAMASLQCGCTVQRDLNVVSLKLALWRR